MSTPDILLTLSTTKGFFPQQAVDAAIENKASVIPLLLKTLDETLKNHEKLNEADMNHIFALYLLANLREPLAFPYILKLAALPESPLQKLLGDLITEDLPRFITSTFDGNLDALKELIENEHAYQWSRDAALRSLIGLMIINQLTREELIIYLRTMFNSSLAKDEGFATSLVNTACDIYPEELMPEIELAFADKKIDEDMVDLRFIKKALALGRDACLKKFVYDGNFYTPPNDLADSMSWIKNFHPPEKIKQITLDKEQYQYIEPRTRPKIGRNEPCPCGSMKKYKKCCLQ